MGATLKPICVDCRLFYRPKRNGTYFTEGMEDGKGGWKSYKIWSGDLWECKGCGHEIIVGVAAAPIRVQHEDDFAQTQQALGANRIIINDC